MKRLDVLRESGGTNKALEQSFHGLRPNAQGKLVLSFVPIVHYAAVFAIEVIGEDAPDCPATTTLWTRSK